MSTAGTATLGDGCDIAWRMDGPQGCATLVLSNPLGITMGIWDALVEVVSPHVRVLRYDTRGHGGSSVTPGDYGLDRLGRDVIELMDQLAIERAHFCGVSLGGMTGQWLGIFAPQRLDRLVLANTSAHMGPAETWQARMNLVRGRGMKAVADAVLSRWFRPNFALAEPARFDRIQDGLVATSPQGYAACCAAIRDMDLRRLTHLIEARTLVIAGVADPATPPAMAWALADSIAVSERMLLDSAHLSNIECSELFSELLLRFITESSGV